VASASSPMTGLRIRQDAAALHPVESRHHVVIPLLS
jgi:hypothetical protein